MKKKIYFSLIMGFMSAIGYSQTLDLSITNIKQVTGDTIYIAFYDSKKTFLKKASFGAKIPITDTIINISFTKEQLPNKEYAISLFVDENRNRKLDTGLFGMPLEKVGFSNNAIGFAGPPSFKKCNFIFNRDITINIELQ